MQPMKKISLTCLIPGMIGVFVIPVVFPTPLEVTAATNDPVQLTYSKVNDTQGKIQITFGTGTTSVLLPNGTRITSNTNYEVNENGEFDFVAYDSDGKPHQKTITVSGLNVDSAPLTTAHGLYVKLHVDAFDTISEVDSYRYRLDNETAWSNWIPYVKNNSKEIQIPVTSNTTSFNEERSIMIEVKDHAGNVRTSQSSIRIDHTYPEIKTTTKTIYTNKEQITFPIETTSFFKSPDTLVVKEGSKLSNIDLTSIQKSETILQRKPNQYKTNWDKVTYNISKKEGLRTLTIYGEKTYKDFKGNIVKLNSDGLSMTTLNVVYDSAMPKGSVVIETDDNGEVPTPEVNVDLNYSDENGIKSVRVYEPNTNNEYYLSDKEIAAGRVTLPWTLYKDKDAQLYMDVEDIAGNKKTFESNKVSIGTIKVTGFTLTKVTNPAVAFPINGYSWAFDGDNIAMVAGGNISFNIYYGIGAANPNNYIISGKYKITMVDENDKVVYESKEIAYTKGFDSNNTKGYAGFTETYKLPSVNKNGKKFTNGTKVYIASTLTRTAKSDGSTKEATFQNVNSTIGNLIGVLGTYNGSASMEDMIRFNEKN